MIAAKVQHRFGSWEAWLGVELAHIARDIQDVGEYHGGTLQLLSPDEKVLKCFKHYAEAVASIQRYEERYRGLRTIPYAAGTSAQYLGKLPSLQPA